LEGREDRIAKERYDGRTEGRKEGSRRSRESRGGGGVRE
jgi:hypothetical protein